MEIMLIIELVHKRRRKTARTVVATNINPSDSYTLAAIQFAAASQPASSSTRSSESFFSISSLLISTVSPGAGSSLPSKRHHLDCVTLLSDRGTVLTGNPYRFAVGTWAGVGRAGSADLPLSCGRTVGGVFNPDRLRPPRNAVRSYKSQSSH